MTWLILLAWAASVGSTEWDYHTQNELDKTRSELDQIHQGLTAAQEEMTSMREESATAQQELATVQEELETAHEQMATMKEDLVTAQAAAAAAAQPICQFCHDQRVGSVMNPCGHTICSECCMNLVDQSEDRYTRPFCPWCRMPSNPMPLRHP
jgi:chromosome segregation ATPase